MIPQWLIIVVGIALALFLAGPFIFAALVGLGAGLAIVVATILDWVLARSGYYRWRRKRRAARIRKRREARCSR